MVQLTNLFIFILLSPSLLVEDHKDLIFSWNMFFVLTKIKLRQFFININLFFFKCIYFEAFISFTISYFIFSHTVHYQHNFRTSSISEPINSQRRVLGQ